MKTTLLKFLCLFSILLSVSCASIVSTPRQNIKFTSTPSSAKVYVNEIAVGKTPFEKRLKRNQNYDVVIKLDGYKTYTTRLTKKFNAWYIGNLGFGGVIGLIVDPITGAMFKLAPEEIPNTMDVTSKGNNLFIAVSLDIDPNWEKVGQLNKAN